MNLKIYTDNIEELAQRQITRLLEQPAFSNAKVRIMPDVHAGKGCVIGFTADLGDKVIPNIVGVDIGCGMYTLALGKQKPDFNMLDDVMHRNIPSGMNVRRNAIAEFEPMAQLHCLEKLHQIPRLHRSLGTLGGGNHFVEVDVDSAGAYYLIIHSGSRNLGHQVCDIYQAEAIDIHSGIADRAEREAAMIAKLKAEGRQQEIQSAINAFRAECAAACPDIPRELCYLEGEARARYLDDMRICQQFALLN
ncbi:MAG: RtcB family protein, partial [Akkermansia sp.]|nr:RtcB family protein [Akkermansia sp.]